MFIYPHFNSWDFILSGCHLPLFLIQIVPKSNHSQRHLSSTRPQNQQSSAIQTPSRPQFIASRQHLGRPPSRARSDGLSPVAGGMLANLHQPPPALCLLVRNPLCFSLVLIVHHSTSEKFFWNLKCLPTYLLICRMSFPLGFWNDSSIPAKINALSERPWSLDCFGRSQTFNYLLFKRTPIPCISS